MGASSTGATVRSRTFDRNVRRGGFPRGILRVGYTRGDVNVGGQMVQVRRQRVQRQVPRSHSRLPRLSLGHIPRERRRRQFPGLEPRWAQLSPAPLRPVQLEAYLLGRDLSGRSFRKGIFHRSIRGGSLLRGDLTGGGFREGVRRHVGSKMHVSGSGVVQGKAVKTRGAQGGGGIQRIERRS